MKSKENTDDGDGVMTNRGLLRLLIFLASITLVLLVAGALVTSNEAGDSVPDWPLSFGRWVINSNYFVANVRFEYSHRVIAFFVGATTLAFAIRAWTIVTRPLIRNLALVALAGVVIQALIGGARVRFPAYKSLFAIPHALVAQSFFALIVGLVVITSVSWQEKRSLKMDCGHPSARWLSILTGCTVLAQAVLGAGFRHGAFGIAPHIAGAIVVSSFTVWIALAILFRHGQNAYLRRPALSMLALLFCQLTLGLLAYIARLRSYNDAEPLEPMITLTVAHVIVGALMLGSVVVLGLRCWRTLSPVHENEERIRVSIDNSSRAIM